MKLSDYFRIVLLLLIFSGLGFSQQITFNACNSLIDTEDYHFEQVSFANDRNSFVTVSDPMLGSRDCSGIGFCKLKIEWSTANMRWEILADDGNDNFINTYLLYYNDEASLPNPPSLSLGTWVEATAITQSLCGQIVTLEGAVQNSVLSTDNFSQQDRLSVFPNPVSQMLYLEGNALNMDYSVALYDVMGKQVFTKRNIHAINVSKYRRGVYFLKVKTANIELNKKILIQ
ncbi:putative secreted protein (Por secretion system target) [Winogradskyella wandonensis]|uniref:Putative secreted protein (Por secretion system target) n=1 Tax=Winogradskyella wandonensis TaxID=1442586 RepID=A0A4R1KSL9_9FLAO|nr:T9SS type A sorting domain-containing protein [Winogradskyella wandonensis]TCK67593.1 putative secreted protein (Por secretion system target) [Winogradskyella wandonensis]